MQEETPGAPQNYGYGYGPPRYQQQYQPPPAPQYQPPGNSFKQKKHFGDKVFKTIIPRNVRLAEAPSYGKPVMAHDKWSKGARAYKQLTKEVLRRV